MRGLIVVWVIFALVGTGCQTPRDRPSPTVHARAAPDGYDSTTRVEPPTEPEPTFWTAAGRRFQPIGQVVLGSALIVTSVLIGLLITGA